MVALPGSCTVAAGETFVVCGGKGKLPGKTYASGSVFVGEDGVWSGFKVPGPNVLKAPAAVTLIMEGAKSAAVLTPEQAAFYALGLKVATCTDAAAVLGELGSVVLAPTVAAANKVIGGSASGESVPAPADMVAFVKSEFPSFQMPETVA